MTNGILCLTDFSDSSKGALDWSIKLAKKLGSHLTLLYTYRLFKQDGETILIKKNMEMDASKNFAALEIEFLTGSGIVYDFKTEVGFVDDRIEQNLKNGRVSFLVMGKGMSLRNKETFDDLLTKLQIPLVIIP
jgi:Universal stress protein family